MIIDSSAVLAVLLAEADAEFFASAIAESDVRRMSAVSALEVSIVIASRKREEGIAVLDQFVERSRIRIVPLDADQVRLAREAWVRYGKGTAPRCPESGGLL